MGRMWQRIKLACGVLLDPVHRPFPAGVRDPAAPRLLLRSRTTRQQACDADTGPAAATAG